MNCCKSSSADTKPGFFRRHAGLLMCAAFLGLAVFLYSRADAGTNSWTWLIALLCPAVHLWMCHQMLKPAAESHAQTREPQADSPHR